MADTGLEFSLNEEQRMMSDEAQKFATGVLREKAREYEEAGAPGEDACITWHEMGLAAVDVPEEIGGADLGTLSAAIVAETLAAGDLGTALSLPGAGAATYALLALGTPEQQEKYLAPFLDPAAADKRGAMAWNEPDGKTDPLEWETKAVKDGDGWKLNGKKALVINAGQAEITVVFALVDGEGLDAVRAFVVEADNPGLKVGERRPILGLNTLTVADIELADCKVAADAALIPDDPKAGLEKMWLMELPVAAARNIGLARASMEYANAYCQERVAFGKPVAHHQGLSWFLTDNIIDVETAQISLWQAAWAVDEGNGSLAEVLRALKTSQEVAMRVADKGVQALGGAGFVRDYLAEKWTRDARTHILLGQTCPLNDIDLGALLLG